MSIIHGFPKLDLPEWIKHEITNPPGSRTVSHATGAAWAYLLRNLKSNVEHKSVGS